MKIKNKHISPLFRVLFVALIVFAGFLINTRVEENDVVGEEVSVLETPTRAGVTDITSIVTSGSSEEYSGRACGSNWCNQLQGFTTTSNRLLFYTMDPNHDGSSGILNAYYGNNFSTIVSGSPFIRGFDHGNDMTYNKKTDEALILSDNYRSVTFINPSTLANKRTVSLSNGTWAIGYDEFHDYYVLLQDKFYLADANFNKKIGFPYILDDGNVSQGIEYHNGYVYYTNSRWDDNLGSLVSYIGVFNAKLKTDGTKEKGFGDRVAYLYIRGIGEIESISFYGSDVYFGFAGSYYDRSFFYHIPSSKIAVPLNVSVSYQDDVHSTTAKITGAAQLKTKSGYTLSSDGYTLSKAVNAKTISENVQVCDNYNNCKTVTLSHTNNSYVQQQSQTVTFANASVTKTYGAASFTNKATTTGNGAITYSSSNTSVATVNSSTGLVTIKGAGTATITAKAAATTYYTAASKTYTLTVNKASQTVTFANPSVTKTYGAASFTNKATTTGKGAITYSSSDTSVATVNATTGAVTIKSAGTAKITATAAATTNYNAASKTYTLTVNKAAQTVTFANASVTKTYGAASFTNKATTTGKGAITYSSSNTSVATVNSSTGLVTIKGAGTATITAKAAATTNYNAASKTYTLTVNKAAQTVTFASTSVTKTYGAASFTNKATTTGKGAITYSSSNTNVATVNATTGAVTIKGAGTATITAKAAATTNYNAASKTYTLTVNKASQTVTFASASVTKTYGAASFTNKATTTGNGAITYSSSNTSVATVNSSTGLVTIKGAGTATITAKAAATTYYTAASKTYTLTVNKAVQPGNPQTVTFANSLSNIVIDYGTTFVNEATSTAVNAVITYSSSDEAVATVDAEGRLTTKKSGTATITAKSVASGFEDATKSYNVTVRYVLSFDNNDADGNVISQRCVVEAASDSCIVTIPKDAPTKDGYYFLGWAEDRDAVANTNSADDQIVLNSNKTLYAIWAPIYTLSFDLASDDMDAVNELLPLSCHPDTVDGTCAVTIASSVPIREDYEFSGWAGDRGAEDVDYYNGQDFVFINGNYDETLYAVWVNGDIVWIRGKQHIRDSGENAIFEIRYPLENFETLYIDDEEVSKDNYGLTEGSTIVTLHADYLETLSEGKHKVVAVYNDGTEVQTSMKIAEKSADEPAEGEIDSPDTGALTEEKENSNGHFLFGAMIVVALVTVTYNVARRIRARRRIRF